MKKYPDERRKAIIEKMAPPHNKSIAQIAKEEGISEPTLYNWRNQARSEGRLLPSSDDSPEGWAAADKFNAVLETAPLSEAQRSEYCRKKGLYPEQLVRWRAACEQANDWDKSHNKELDKQVRGQREQIRSLERDLQRKEKALAEAAALLVLRKNVQAIWGDEER